MADHLTSQAPRHVQHVPGPLNIAVRPATAEDRGLLLAAYASTRSDELALVPWSEQEKSAFVAMQFSAQDAWYRRVYPDGEFLVVTRGDEPVGRLYHADLPEEVRLIEMTLLPEHRNQGIGSRLLAQILARADREGRWVRLHVEPWNPALRLYERHGFTLLEERGAYLFLERAPAPPPAVRPPDG